MTPPPPPPAPPPHNPSEWLLPQLLLLPALAARDTGWRFRLVLTATDRPRGGLDPLLRARLNEPVCVDFTAYTQGEPSTQEAALRMETPHGYYERPSSHNTLPRRTRSLSAHTSEPRAHPVTRILTSVRPISQTSFVSCCALKWCAAGRPVTAGAPTGGEAMAVVVVVVVVVVLGAHHTMTLRVGWTTMRREYVAQARLRWSKR